MINIQNGKGERFVNGLTNLDNALVEVGFLSNPNDVAKLRANNGYNVVLGLTNGLLESKGYSKIGNLISMQKTAGSTQYVQNKKNLQNIVLNIPKKKNKNQIVAKTKKKNNTRNV